MKILKLIKRAFQKWSELDYKAHKALYDNHVNPWM